MKRIFFIVLFTLVFGRLVSYGQGDSTKNKISRLTAFSENQATEKLYLQFDKPYYAIGDTIWFKAWLLNSFLLPSAKSGVLNIDIADDSDKVIKQFRLPVQGGLTWGNIGLNDKDFKAGTYTLRAYTNWMRNFADDGFFYKTFIVSGADNGQLLVNAAFAGNNINGNPSVETKLRFNTLAGLPFAIQPVTLQVLNNGKRLYAQKYVTGVDGGLDVNFNPPQKTDHLAIVALNDKKERLAVIPVPVNRPPDVDVQFLPEGGALVAGLPAHVGFKAVGEDGKAVDVSGVIFDRNQKQVAAFKSLHNGMGSFDMMIAEGESYTARVTLPGGLIKQYILPPVKNTGTALSIKNEEKSDSLSIRVAASGDITPSAQSFFLIGRARGIVCYAAIVNFRAGNTISKKIAKSLFPSGIAHFTLMTTAYQPVNERLTFIDHDDNLNIKLTPDKSLYGKRDSVALKLKVTDQDGDPVAGNFSIAVTDDAQVKPGSLNEENIATRFMLTADLKGYIEQPGYYLSSKNPEAWQALDNLLLTQGWVGYDWAMVFNPPPIAYKPEEEFKVTGHVFNILNKPVKGTSIMLFSKTPSILMDTMTDKDGKFVFDRLPRVDTPVFVLKAVNKNGKSFNVGISVDEIVPPVFAKPAMPLTLPWFVNIDTTLLTYTKTAAQINQQRDFAPGGHVLKEVNIKAKKIIKDSQNLNGSGNADFVLDEQDLEAAGKKTWLQLLQENIKGFREGIFDVMGGDRPKVRRNLILNLYVTDKKLKGPSREWYFVNGQPIKLIVDGISVNQILEIGDFFDLREYLAHSAEDIKGIEMITSAKYTAAYLQRYDPDNLIVGALLGNPPVSITPSDIAFIEITTRSGNGPGIINTPGRYLYKPLPLSWPKAFYKPKYTVNDTSQNRVDLRSTIDWEPNIVTDANGEATIWFYTADKPSTYTVTVEGADMNGHLGFKQDKINIGTNKEKSR